MPFLILLVFCILEGVASYEKLTNNGIFTFQNRHDGNFLTAINLHSAENPPVVLDEWKGASTQKWRAVKALTSMSYQLKPTSDEHRVLNLDPVIKSLASQSNAGLGLSSGQYWYIKLAGEGYIQVINYYTHECLHTQGFGKKVGVEPCNNSHRQQWVVKEL